MTRSRVVFPEPFGPCTSSLTPGARVGRPHEPRPPGTAAGRRQGVADADHRFGCSHQVDLRLVRKRTTQGGRCRCAAARTPPSAAYHDGSVGPATNNSQRWLDGGPPGPVTSSRTATVVSRRPPRTPSGMPVTRDERCPNHADQTQPWGRRPSSSRRTGRRSLGRSARTAVAAAIARTAR